MTMYVATYKGVSFSQPRAVAQTISDIYAWLDTHCLSPDEFDIDEVTIV